jgi:hypothetical protein
VREIDRVLVSLCWAGGYKGGGEWVVKKHSITLLMVSVRGRGGMDGIMRVFFNVPDRGKSGQR